jgi:hypothetical protein
VGLWKPPQSCHYVTIGILSANLDASPCRGRRDFTWSKLPKGGQYPIGAITWGSGSIGYSSISTLVKDFRKKLTDEIFHEKYEVKRIAEKFAEFIYKDHYQPAFSSWEMKPDIGFIITGYDSGKDYAEVWDLEINNGQFNGLKCLRKGEEAGISWSGDPEAITRLYLGYGTMLPQILAESDIDSNQIDRVMSNIKERLMVPLVIPALPIQDAIDLADFLVQMTMQFSKYAPGPTTVGGPIEIAVFTKHEGFKWIKRKHYFNDKLNPVDQIRNFERLEKEKENDNTGLQRNV